MVVIVLKYIFIPVVNIVAGLGNPVLKVNPGHKSPQSLMMSLKSQSQDGSLSEIPPARVIWQYMYETYHVNIHNSISVYIGSIHT